MSQASPRRRTKNTAGSSRGGSKHRDEDTQRREHTAIRKSVRDHIAIVAVAVFIFVAAWFYSNYLLFEPSSQDTHPWPFDVVDIPGRGKGAVAARDIHQGELILREKPLFTIPTQVNTISPGAMILSSLAALTAAQRAAFYNLSHVNFNGAQSAPGTPKYHEELALAITLTNAVQAGDHSGIFPRMARLNHGCSKAFNSVYNWRADEGVIVVHALKPIRQGQELLTTYLDTKRPRHERRQILQAHYGFNCECSVCSLPDELSRASDLRLTAMADLYAKFATWGQQAISGRDAVSTAKEIWAVGEQEGYWSERGRLAADAAWVAAAHADAQAVESWSHVALEWYAYELGADSQHVRESRQFVAEPSNHPAWGTRHPEQVGGPEGGPFDVEMGGEKMAE